VFNVFHAVIQSAVGFPNLYLLSRVVMFDSKRGILNAVLL
jgi:hypothetical protein